MIKSLKTRSRPRTRAQWSDHKKWGACEACGRYGPLHAHHVVQAQVVRRVAPEREFDLTNRMLLGWECCHGAHHAGGDGRLPFEAVPERCRTFAREVLGDGPAAIYFARRYRVEDAKRSCDFCHGEPVGDAASWLDGKPRPPAPCPRCGETNYPKEG